ncbi:hypothetical protein E2320_002961, partial [Naja naja]
MFTGCFAYLKPMSDSSTHLDFIITIMYSIIPSMMNPFIYCMRNKDIKVGFSRLFGQMSFQFKELTNPLIHGTRNKDIRVASSRLLSQKSFNFK